MFRRQIEQLITSSGAEAIAAAYYDYETETSWSFHGARWFHAASTVKAALLAAVFDAVARGEFSLESRVHVRNRFLSVHDGEPYRVQSNRDANNTVHNAIGKTLKVKHLAHHMIATSSNLATNLLFDIIGPEAARATVGRLGIEGIDVRRGVEDERAHAAGINNRVTAFGLLRLFQALHESKGFRPEYAARMIAILEQQEFRRGIPAGLPEAVRDAARIAHKTGEISTVAHDAGLVYLPGRKPYALVVLTEWPPRADGRQDTVAAVSRLVYDVLTENEAPHA